RAPLPVPPMLIVCTVPLALMLKLMVSLTPYVPVRLAVTSALKSAPLLIEVIASRREAVPSSELGASRSSFAEVTVMTAGASRSSSCSRCRGRRRGRRAVAGEKDHRWENQDRMAHRGEWVVKEVLPAQRKQAANFPNLR